MNCCFRFIFPSVGRLMFERLRGNSLVVVVVVVVLGMVGLLVGGATSWVWFSVGVAFSVGVSLSFFSAGEGSTGFSSVATGSAVDSGCC